jgi:signal transduction histidine kinase
LRRWTVVIGIGSVVAIFSILQIYVVRAALGHPPEVWPLIRMEGPIWVFWMCAAVPIVMLARAVPLDGRRVVGPTIIHLLFTITIATLFVGFRTLWYQAFNPYPLQVLPVSRWFWQISRDSFIDGLVLYWAILGVYYAYASYARVRQRDLEASLMRARLAEANLQALKMQIRPHFLFNSLNTASAILEQDPRTARRVLGRLGELLRASLQTEARDEITLSQEVEVLRGFLEIEQARFGPRLEVEFRLSADTLNAAVPSFVLQPLVENAVHHGVANKRGVGHLVVESVRRGHSLELRVRDDGPGLPQGTLVERIGLSNTRGRMRELYGAEQELALRSRPEGGLEVTLSLPFRLLEQTHRSAG